MYSYYNSAWTFRYSQRFILELNPIMALCPHSPRGEKGESTIISNLSEPGLDQKESQFVKRKTDSPSELPVSMVTASWVASLPATARGSWSSWRWRGTWPFASRSRSPTAVARARPPSCWPSSALSSPSSLFPRCGSTTSTTSRGFFNVGYTRARTSLTFAL